MSSVNRSVDQSAGSKSGLLESLGNDNDRGALCNDPNGLCLGSVGAIHKSGVYTSLVRLASKLGQGNGSEAPLITIETDAGAILVKEYDGHAVALRVPVKSKDESENGASEADVGETQQQDKSPMTQRT